MKHAFLPTSALVILVCFHTPTDAKAPITPLRTTTPSDFYQVIITNNLFRPLGWTKPKTPPAFELIATVMRSKGNHKALLRNTRNRKVYYAAVGDELEAGVTVEKIESRQVTANENGKLTVYRLKRLNF